MNVVQIEEVADDDFRPFSTQGVGTIIGDANERTDVEPAIDEHLGQCSSDGTHLSPGGGERLSQAVLASIRSTLHINLSG